MLAGQLMSDRNPAFARWMLRIVVVYATSEIRKQWPLTDIGIQKRIVPVCLKSSGKIW